MLNWKSILPEKQNNYKGSKLALYYVIILLLEKEKRSGGRGYSEEIYETTNNIGTQFFSEADSSFVNLINELGIERICHNPISEVDWNYFIEYANEYVK